MYSNNVIWKETAYTYTREKPVKGWEGCAMRVLGSRGKRTGTKSAREESRSKASMDQPSNQRGFTGCKSLHQNTTLFPYF